MIEDTITLDLTIHDETPAACLLSLPQFTASASKWIPRRWLLTSTPKSGNIITVTMLRSRAKSKGLIA